MMDRTFEILITFAIYFSVTYAAFWLTEIRFIKPFSYFDKYPFRCRKCLSFWGLLLTYLSIAYILNNLFIGIAGGILTVMNAIADIYTENERKKPLK